MAKYKVFAERKETEYAIIEANSAEEANKLACLDDSDYDWQSCDGSMTWSIIEDETEETDDE